MMEKSNVEFTFIYSNLTITNSLQCVQHAWLLAFKSNLFDFRINASSDIRSTPHVAPGRSLALARSF